MSKLAQHIKKMFAAAKRQGLYIGLGHDSRLPEDRQEGAMVKKLRQLVEDEPEFTDRDLNLLNSCAHWLETRSDATLFKSYSGLMKEYAAKLRSIHDRIAPLAVAKPVTLDEVFGNKK